MMKMLDLCHVRKVLQGHEGKTYRGYGLKAATVMLPLYSKDDTVEVVLNQRYMDVGYHRGEISFPGGKN